MADISRLARILGDKVRGVDLSSNTLVIQSIKIGAGQTELTQTILDKLVLMQSVADGDGYYDSRYFTESELGADGGAALIGVDDALLSNISGADLQEIVESIDSALSGTADELIKISANDTTAGYLEDKIVVDVGSNSSNALEASTLNDGANEDLRIRFDQSKVDHGSIAGLSDDDHTQYILVAGTRAFTGNQSMGNNKITSLANGSASGDAVNFSQLQAVANSVINFEFKNSVLDVQEDNLLDPGASPVLGDRYLILDASNLHANFGTITGVADNDIVEFDGSDFVVSFSPSSAGPFVSSDADQSFLYQYSGSAWVQKNFEATTASTGLTKVGFDIRLDSSSAGSGLGFSSGVLSVNVDDSTLEINSDTLRIKDLGVATGKLADDVVTKEKINADVAGSGLGQNVDGSLEVKVDDSSIEINSDTLRVKAGGITDAMAASGSNLEEAVNFFNATNISGAEAEQLSDGSNADSLHFHSGISELMVAGESMAANTTFLVRFAKNGETAGRVYKADKDASSADNFHCVGFAKVGSAVSAGDPVRVYKLGKFTLASGDSNFNATDIGKPIFLQASGAFSITAPSTADHAIKQCGIVAEVDKIEVQILSGIVY